MYTTILAVMLAVITILACDTAPPPPRQPPAPTSPVPATRILAEPPLNRIDPTDQHNPYSDINFPTPTPPLWARTTPSSTGRTARTEQTATPGNETMAALFHLAILPQGHQPPAPYQRDSWNYGIDHDADCQYTRNEILVRDSQSLATFTDDRNCKVAAGTWTDPWDNLTYTDPDDLEIDHHVPLHNAHVSGGHSWPPTVKAAYANDIDHPFALNAISTKNNQDKGASPPHQWKPPDNTTHCQYATAWIAVKFKWQLAVTIDEKQALIEMLSHCPH